MACDNTLHNIWPEDIYVVCGAGQLITPGATSSTFETMKNWEIRIMRGGQPLWYGDPGNGSSYFEYVYTTGVVAWSAAAVNGEEFIIQAYKPAIN